jgi:hypothetical protein
MPSATEVSPKSLGRSITHHSTMTRRPRTPRSGAALSTPRRRVPRACAGDLQWSVGVTGASSVFLRSPAHAGNRDPTTRGGARFRAPWPGRWADSVGRWQTTTAQDAHGQVFVDHQHYRARSAQRPSVSRPLSSGSVARAVSRAGLELVDEIAGGASAGTARDPRDAEELVSPPAVGDLVREVSVAQHSGVTRHHHQEVVWRPRPE